MHECKHYSLGKAGERRSQSNALLHGPTKLHKRSGGQPGSEHPQNRVEAARPAYEELGVTIHDAYLAFGEYDVVVITEAPGNVQATAIAMAVVAGGGVSKYKTTPLMTWEEGVEAMQAAGGSGYQPPSS